VLAQLTDDDVLARVQEAGRHYADRNADFAARLTERGLPTEPGDGLNLWVPLPIRARVVAERLMRRGWLARTGDEFQLAEHPAPSQHLRLTVHDLDEDETERLLDDLTEAALGR
jgi:DNA-binding transcriptional MocR family regulator